MLDIVSVDVKTRNGRTIPMDLEKLEAFLIKTASTDQLLDWTERHSKTLTFANGRWHVSIGGRYECNSPRLRDAILGAWYGPTLSRFLRKT